MGERARSLGTQRRRGQSWIKVGIGIQVPAFPLGPEQFSESPQSGGTEVQRQAGNVRGHLLAGALKAAS